MMNATTQKISAAALGMGIVALAYSLDQYIHLGLIASSLVVGLLLSILGLGKKLNFLPFAWLEKLTLPVSIILLGFDVSFEKIAEIPPTALIFIVLMMAIILYISHITSKKNLLNSFIGIGTAICGNSAIVAYLGFKPNEAKNAAIAIGIINLIGIIGLALIPGIAYLLNLSAQQGGFLAGASLHAVGNALAAGFAMGEVEGQLATLIKLARVSLLGPALLFLLYLSGKNSEAKISWKQVPWFLWFFLGAMLITNVVSLPKEFLNIAKSGSTYLLSIAMAAIGIRISLKELQAAGPKAIGFGFAIFGIQIALILGYLLIFDK